MSGNTPCNKRKEVKRGDSTDTTLAELKRRASKDPAEYVKWYLVGKTKSVLSWNIIAEADAAHTLRNGVAATPLPTDDQLGLLVSVELTEYTQMKCRFAGVVQR